MVKSYSFSQNTLFLLVSYIIEKILVFFFFIFLARYLGPHDFGTYSFATSFVALFSVFFDLAFATVLVRETAKHRERAKEFLENAIAVKLIASVCTAILIFIIINLLNYADLTKYFVYLVVFWVFFESLGATFYSSFRGQHNLRYEATGFIIDKVAYVFLGMALIFFKLPLLTFAIPLVVSGFLYLLYSFLVTKKYFIIKPKLNKEIFNYFFKIAFPIIFGIIFSTVFFSINTVLVSYLSSDRAAGLFSAAFRIPAALLFLPMAVGASIFPVFSSLAKENREKLSEIFEKVLFYMIFLSFPIMVGGLILGSKIITFTYGLEFLEAVSSFKLLIIALFFMFLDFLFSSLLTALNKQKQNAISRGIGLLFNVVLCFILIPSMAQLGGSIAFIIGFSVFAIVQLFLILKLVPIHFSRIGKKFFLVLVSCLTLSIIIFILKDILHLFILLIVGGIVYALCLYLLGAVKKEDIIEIKSLIRSSLKGRSQEEVQEKIQETEQI